MSIQAGEKMPAGVFGVMTDAGPGAMSTDDLFAGKKVVLVSVPGAFTPTCSMNHLPGFVDQADAIQAKGVDTVACMAVNDVFGGHRARSCVRHYAEHARGHLFASLN